MRSHSSDVQDINHTLLVPEQKYRAYLLPNRSEMQALCVFDKTLMLSKNSNSLQKALSFSLDALSFFFPYLVVSKLQWMNGNYLKLSDAREHT